MRKMILPLLILGMVFIPSVWADSPIKNENIEFFKGGKRQIDKNKKKPTALLDGVRKEYYSGGQLRAERTYKRGVLDGPTKLYARDGKLREEENYVNGKRDGLRREYFQDSSLRQEENF